MDFEKDVESMMDNVDVAELTDALEFFEMDDSTLDMMNASVETGAEQDLIQAYVEDLESDDLLQYATPEELAELDNLRALEENGDDPNEFADLDDLDEEALLAKLEEETRTEEAASSAKQEQEQEDSAFAELNDADEEELLAALEAQERAAELEEQQRLHGQQEAESEESSEGVPDDEIERIDREAQAKVEEEKEPVDDLADADFEEMMAEAIAEAEGEVESAIAPLAAEDTAKVQEEIVPEVKEDNKRDATDQAEQESKEEVNEAAKEVSKAKPVELPSIDTQKADEAKSLPPSLPSPSSDVSASAKKPSIVVKPSKPAQEVVSPRKKKVRETEEQRIQRTKNSLLSRMQARQALKNKQEFTDLNLHAMSAMAMAEIKRFSLSSKCVVDVKVEKATDLHSGKTYPSPVVYLAIRKDTSKDHEKKVEVKKEHEVTEVKLKTANPQWNESKTLKVDQIKGQSQRWLVVEVRDKNAKGHCLGFVEVNLNNIADLVERQEWYTLEKRSKKDKVSGKILLTLVVRPEQRAEDTLVIKNENFPTIPSFIYSSYWNAHCTTKLSVTHCGISSVPEGIFNLSSLQVLILSNNNLSTLPKTLGRIYSLKLLDVSNNRITKLPGELSNLKNLQTLRLGNNHLDKDVVPPCVFDLDVWCEIEGKPEEWLHMIEEELAKREQNTDTEAVDTEAVAEKEKEIQRLLAAMNN